MDLRLLALWTVIIGMAQCCPESCICQDKYAHQFADCAYKDLLAVPVGLPSNVTTLSLSANKITLLKSKSFANVTQVTSLWLAHNEIVTIESGTLAPLVQLRNLDLSHNKIVNFPWEDLYNLSALQLLKMNNNEMVNLPKDAFATLKDLRSLRINNNKFTTIVQGTFDALSSMSHLQIYNNPFTCSCTLEWLRDYIAETKISIPEQNSIVCESPAQLKGTLLMKVPKLECLAPTVSISYQPNIENTELYEGFMLILNCETKGNPRPNVAWKIRAGNQDIELSLPGTTNEKNDLPVDTKMADNRFLVFQNGTLIIPRMSKKEDGNYSCSAVNELGKAESTVKVVVAGTKKQAKNSMLDPTGQKISPAGRVPGPKTSKNSVINWPTSEEKRKIIPTGSTYITVDTAETGKSPMEPTFASKCGISDGTLYISNHAFNMSLDELKQYTFDFGVIALEVSETEAKVQLNPLHLPSAKTNLHLSPSQELETVNKEPSNLYQASPKKLPLDMLYLCVNTGNGHSVVQWSKIEDGINAYRFQGLQPGTNYTLCLTYGGSDCHVQVVFTTRKKIPSLLIIVVVSAFLLALATVPLLGATCCHLLYKYQGKTYKLIMKTQNPDQMEKHMAADFDPRSSFVESEKNFNPSEQGEGEGEEGEGEGEVEGSVVADSIVGSQSKTNQEEFEVGSEYSDRLPLGAEAVNISEEINGNYKQPAR
ncbi:immunoglobulin superfamily containing leucine-rich repeat protein 2-like [Scleropages formosus]|uniref:Immunoglobulin superfamily containing leucine-rich repeat 2 n=1 Tax=Scleropages formosus TaxID=113540 RepID=A0A8C9SIQ6_SCLFO|nr:immunoglobulin superfamily containing leucine-rich repeat protein 2 [Scleropages formosus]KPP78154.1 immunoglobulin superfamily containing leucine-rich repeat protein 2-like [Scleropages formosus]